LGWGHSLALTAEGHVYSWGYAANGRLGFQPFHSELQASSLSKDRDHGEAIEDAAYRQVLEYMEKEKSPVLAWEPVRVDALRSHRVIEISCGMDHSLTLNGTTTLVSSYSNIFKCISFLLS
jgi:alpha-tubulin suppressor-like RCC1 family protein